MTLQLSETDYPSVVSLLGTKAPSVITGVGDLSLLRLSLTAFFSSIRVPPDLILPTLDLARELRRREIPVIGGFQSPTEREVLRLLLRGAQPVVICLARRLEDMRFPAAWTSWIDAGRLLVVSGVTGTQRRATAESSVERNQMVAAVAESMIVVHARPGSRTFQTVRRAVQWGKEVYCFDHPWNRDLTLVGARTLESGSNPLPVPWPGGR